MGGFDSSVGAAVASVQGQGYIAFNTAGTSTAYTGAVNPAVAAYVINQEFDITFDKTCGANPTININGLGAMNLVDRLASGVYYNIPAGRIPATLRSRCVVVSANQIFVRDTPCETISSTVVAGSAVALTTAAWKSVTSIALPPGDWMINGVCIFSGAAGTNSSLQASGIATTQDATPIQTEQSAFYSVPGLANLGMGLTSLKKVSSNVASSAFLEAYGTFTVSTLAAYGLITATRIKT